MRNGVDYGDNARMLIFLQNPWSPVYAGRAWPRASWLRALARSRSGLKVRLLTDDFACVHNASPVVADNPRDVMPPDDDHISAILAAAVRDRQPAAPRVRVVACGKHAEEALTRLWPGHLLVLPHPAHRVVTTALYVRARELLDEPGFFGRWALRQGRGHVQLEPIGASQ